MDSSSNQRLGFTMLSLTGRMLIGYLLLKAVSFARASSLPEAGSDANTLDQSGNFCTRDQISAALDSIKQDSSQSEGDLAQLLFEHCTTDFLVNNSISPKVKQVVDEWIGIDVGKAKTNQLFWMHQVALQSPKPQGVGEQFISDCTRMNDAYETFRLATEPLASKIDIQMSQEDEDLTDDQRDFLAFTLYTRFCGGIVEAQTD